MKLHVFFITTLAIIGLVFWLITWALGQAFSQDHPVSKQQPRLFVSLQYMDAEGCANRDKVTNSDSCVQNVQPSNSFLIASFGIPFRRRRSLGRIELVITLGVWLGGALAVWIILRWF